MTKNKKKKYKSVITKRIYKSIRKVSIVAFLLFAILQAGKIQGTNSSFVDTISASSIHMATGYWVVPEISFINPAGGETWQVSDTETLMWTVTVGDPSATITSLDLEYSCDGKPYAPIHHFSSNAGSYHWTVPEDISNNCKIKVSATDSHGLSNSKESNKFSISWMVVLNEFVPNPSGNDDALMPGGEWVELYNSGSVSVNLNGWYLYDSNNAHELQVTSSNTVGGTIIASHGFLVVFRNHDGDFELNNDGDIVRLYDKAIGSGGHLTDSFSYTVANVSGDTDPVVTMSAPNVLEGDVPENTAGKSFARFPDGIGAWFDPIPTPGEKNTKSLKTKKFIEYYQKRCVDDGKLVSIEKDPVCDIKFLWDLGIIDKKGGLLTDEELQILLGEQPTGAQDEAATVDIIGGIASTANASDENPTDNSGTASATENKETVKPVDGTTAPSDPETNASDNKDSAKEDAGDKPAETIVVPEETKLVPANVPEEKKEDEKEEISKKEEEKPKEEVRPEEPKKEEVPKEDVIVSEIFDYLKIKNIYNLC